MSLGLCAGDQIYKFTLKHPLGAGCFGEVWLAHDNSIDKDIAVKIIDPQGALSIDSFKEARIGNRFDHDNLVKIHYADLATDNRGRTFIIIAMDYLQRGSVITCLNSRGFLPLKDALQVIRNILFGLDHLHRLNFFHNDIKPGNILIGDAGQGVLSDYGIARTQDDHSVVQCYLLHRAPEIRTGGSVSVQTDIFQCGMTAFRLLCGDSLLSDAWNRLGEDLYAESIARGSLITKKDFPQFIPSRVRRMILKAISVSAEDRYGSAYQMLQDLEKLAYVGFWTADETNQLIGRRVNSENIYRYDSLPVGGGAYRFNAYVKYPSGREVLISKFCRGKISKTEMLKAQNKFVDWVVEGGTHA